jgi:hypothetical protein
MQPLATALRRLERLKALVDEYNLIKYQSTERARELAGQIPEAYGSVETRQSPVAHTSTSRTITGTASRHVASSANFWIGFRTRKQET